MIFFSKAVKETSKQVLCADHGDDVKDDFKTLKSNRGVQSDFFLFLSAEKKTLLSVYRVFSLTL
jgi:hypothetical protein